MPITSSTERESKILLMWLSWNWTGAKLSNILDYQIVPILTLILTGNFLLWNVK